MAYDTSKVQCSACAVLCQCHMHAPRELDVPFYPFDFFSATQITYYFLKLFHNWKNAAERQSTRRRLEMQGWPQKRNGQQNWYQGTALLQGSPKVESVLALQEKTT